MAMTPSMKIEISFNEDDRALLQRIEYAIEKLIGDYTEDVPAEPEEEPKPAPKKRAAVKKAEPTDEAKSELQAAVDRATELLVAGEREKVKSALEIVGVSRIREVTAEDAHEFMAALS